MAVTEVMLRLKNDDGEIVASGRQAIVAVREGGQWKVAIVREWDRDVGLDASLKELEWLIGTWQAATKDRDVTITYEWDENKAGAIRGNYYSALSDTTLPVYGSVDKKTRRAAWTVGDRKAPIFEAGFANLTKSETTMLVHVGKGRTQQWTLVRSEQPAEPK